MTEERIRHVPFWFCNAILERGKEKKGKKERKRQKTRTRYDWHIMSWELTLGWDQWLTVSSPVSPLARICWWACTPSINQKGQKHTATAT
jgi:hypothetical protein